MPTTPDNRPMTADELCKELGITITQLHALATQHPDGEEPIHWWTPLTPEEVNTIIGRWSMSHP